MKYILILLLLPGLFACNSNEKDVNQLIFYKNQPANWITDGRELPDSDSLFYLNNPAPVFRKAFSINKQIEAATLYITAAGYYQASLNGARIGKNVLDPAWTDFSKRIYFSEYDVTSLIGDGENCMGVLLGNGFYNPLPMRKWGRRNPRVDLHVGKPAFIAKLLINYADGSFDELISDTSWKYNYGPLIKNSVYLGVAYDAREEIDDWNKPDFDASAWQPALVDEGPGGKLQPAFFPPVQVTQEISPVAIYTPEPGVWMVDMGVNFTGTYKIKLAGDYGDTISFRFGERIYEDSTLNPMTTVIGQIKKKGIGGPGAPDVAWQTDSYVISDDTTNWFQPDFTYHVYRYMEIRGLSEKPDISDVTGLALNSTVAGQNHFSSSSALLNQIQEATERTFLSNLVSVQSDCAAREKFGYGGDLNATSESFIYNYDMQSFYRKTIYDWVDAMNDSTFVDTAPYAGVQYCGISWESAFLTTQYYLYLYYNDTDIVRELYALDKQWMDKVARIHPDGLVEEGLSDHESLKPVPVELTGTTHYLQCARIMQEFATLMGDQESEQQYRQLAGKLETLVRKKFWDQPVTGDINRQTLFSTLLYHDIVPEEEIEAARDSLLNAVNKATSGHFITGIFGTKYVLETLSEYVSADRVFEIVNSTEYPGWGHMIDNGATTIWETWKESDNVYSNNHPMFGSVTEWYYRWLAGIRPDDDYPGFETFTLAPSMPGGLDSVDCTYHSPYGAIVSRWEKLAADTYRYTFAVPDGSSANVQLPLGPNQKISLTSSQDELDPGTIEGLETGSFRLQGGEYTFTILPVSG
ncbi:family 78 glycoside hydrolase catalytic domain [Catalinimonas alkaloidigena]|uniref:family 78 glycoside hydrolase catalytic domain n=1 Tax=Catalinimonas alkaloidigena TaxID=1075417 RepID=UPI0024071101|nr:family 78 glycoside hydrolase catalytic domain [Catalinimonas alkaloidigena]